MRTTRVTCDECRQDIRRAFPNKHYSVDVYGTGTESALAGGDFCSWNCLAYFASKKCEVKKPEVPTISIGGISWASRDEED